MLVSVTNCVSHGGAFFFQKPREVRPIECSLTELHELAGETGISVDDVISRLDDFASADTLLGLGAPFFVPPRENPPLARTEEISVFSVRAPFAPTETVPLETAAVFEAEQSISEETEALFESEPPIIADEPKATKPMEQLLCTETEIAMEEVPPIAGPTKPAIETTAETIETAEPNIETALIVAEPAAKATENAASAMAAKSAHPKPFAPDSPFLKMTRAKLEKIRRLSTVRVEAAVPEDDGEDEPLIDLHVPENYAVQTTTENIVWPWEIREDLTLKEALESLDDKLLTSLTEEVVRCTISGEMGEGGIKSLCETYGRAKEQIYSAIQRESRRRITRMNAKPHTASATAPDATQEMAMRMAKQLLEVEMSKEKATRFKSTMQNEDGNYYIFQKHRIEDEDSVDFPNERVYYREVGDGWAISVGY